MTTKALPEQYRLARSIRPGYEVRVTNNITGEKVWLPVLSELTILAPLKVTQLKLDTSVDPHWGDDGDTVSCRPDDSVMSRRPTGGAS